MRISDWSSDVCSSDLGLFSVALSVGSRRPGVTWHLALRSPDFPPLLKQRRLSGQLPCALSALSPAGADKVFVLSDKIRKPQCQSTKRSEEHTSELKSLMRISYDVF